jgi:hypothetical protein
MFSLKKNNKINTFVYNIKNIFIFILIFSHFFLWDIKTFFIDNLLVYRLLDFKYFFIILLFFSLKKYFFLEAKKFNFLFIFFILHEFLIFFYKITFNLFNVLSFIFFLILFFLTVNYKKEFLKCLEQSYLFFIILSIFFLSTQLFENVLLGGSCNLFILKNKFLFYENSHFGMIFPALLIFFSYRLSKKFTFLNFFYFTICVFYFIMFFSLTGSVGAIVSIIALWFFNYKSFKNKIISILFVFIIISSCSFIFFKKSCSERISEIFIKNKENINTSSLVYRSAFNISFKSLVSYPAGLGINNYSIAHNKFNGEDNIFVKQLNFNDGRSVFFKIVSEYGIFSLIFLYFIIFYLNSSRILIEEKILITPIVLTQLISGAGYFNGGFIIAYFILCVSVVQTKITFFGK